MSVAAALSSGLAPLTAYQQFVCWELRSRDGKKPTKVPINPRTGGMASSVNSATWSDHTTAIHYASQHPGMGVGFVFTDNDPFVFVDIDNCRLPDGQWSPLAIKLCTEFAGGFVEVSQSGNGLHIIARGKRPADHACKAEGFDVYDNMRFCSLTGAGCNGSADADHTATTDRIVRSYMAPDTEKLSIADWTDTACEGWAGTEDDDELIAIALGSKSLRAAFTGGVTFADLWQANEDALGHAYPHDQGTEPFDRSRADSALVQHLAFYTGKNAERIDRLFRQSALMRDKWEDRDDYRTGTILRAISLQGEVYKSKGARTAEAVAVVTAPAAPVATNARPAIQPGMATFTKDHLPNAATFMQCFYPGGSLARVDEEMYRWTGKVWEIVSKPELEHELTVAMSHSTPQKDVVNGTLSMLCALVHKPGLTLGDYPGKQPGRLVHFDNGILDLDSMSLSPHDPSWFSTNILPYAYTTGAGCQHWQQFLSSIFEGDDQRVQLLQEWFGYMLVRSYEHQKGMLMIGAPRSGKGTIGRILREMVGPFNFSGVSLDGFASDPVLDAISDKPVVFVGDARTVDHGSRSKVLARILEIIGQDEVSFNRKWIRKAHNSSMPCRITIAANGVPEFLDHSGALSERLLILPFNKSFAGREDPYLKDKLLQELPGICCWAIAGLQRLRAQGRFTDVAAAAVEREDMQSIQSPLHDFAALCLSFTPDAKVSTEDLYQAYVAYCIRNGQYKVGRNKLVSEMRTAFRGRIEKRPIRFDGVSKQGFTGVGLRPDADMGVTPHLVA